MIPFSSSDDWRIFIYTNLLKVLNNIQFRKKDQDDKRFRSRDLHLDHYATESSFFKFTFRIDLVLLAFTHTFALFLFLSVSFSDFLFCTSYYHTFKRLYRMRIRLQYISSSLLPE